MEGKAEWISLSPNSVAHPQVCNWDPLTYSCCCQKEEDQAPSHGEDLCSRHYRECSDQMLLWSVNIAVFTTTSSYDLHIHEQGTSLIRN